MGYSVGRSYSSGCLFLANDPFFLNNNLCLLMVLYLTVSYELLLAAVLYAQELSETGLFVNYFVDVRVRF